MTHPKNGPKPLSPQWWQNKDVSHAWCARFCEEFFKEDPTLKSDPQTFESVGVVFFNKPSGEIVPAGFTAIQDGNFVFQYHHSYLNNATVPAISDTLPKRKERYVAKAEMLPFFDNLPAEGWFGKAQGAALGDESCKRDIERKNNHMDDESLGNRYHRFMMFGRDYPGAVWATYIRNDPDIAAENHQHTIEAALRSRSSIAGMQPKLLGVANEKGEIHPANFWETSTHIVKLPPAVHMPRLMEYEYMSNIATKALLPNDPPSEASLTELHLRNGDKKEVLAIKRFDRTAAGEKIHFEEMNQLMGKQNSDRYNGAYADVAKLVREKAGHEGVKQFYARLVTQFLLGNTDNHLKNFAMFHDHATGQWSMTPDYDLAPTVNYQKSELALYATKHRATSVGGGEAESKEQYGNLNAKILVTLGQDFGLSLDEVKSTIKGILANIPKAKEAVRADPSPRLDLYSPATETAITWARQKGQHSVKHKVTSREDFCDLLDGRAQKLFGTLDKYIKLVESKRGTAQGR